MKKKTSFSLFYISLIVFFLLVIARAFIIITALNKANHSQAKAKVAAMEILTHLDSLEKGNSYAYSKSQKELTEKIRAEVNIGIAHNKLMAATSNRALNFAIISMIILSSIFVIIILRFNRKIKKNNLFLEAALKERDVFEKKIALQNTELIKANHELDGFVHSASHDLRAPLASILGLINLMQQDETEKEKRNLLDMMRSSIEKLDFFIQDIIEYSRNSRLSIRREKIDFAKLIDECIKQFEYLKETKNIKFITEINGEDEFYSDGKRISVILNNFISNGIKYHDSRKENPYLKISIKKSNDFADIEISDNGIGIQEKYLDKIFNMFYRATQGYSGSGIGLYIVKEVVEKLGGKIHVQSKEKAGSSFFVQLPNLKNT